MTTPKEGKRRELGEEEEEKGKEKENPRDGGAWWAAVYGDVQRWTRLSDLTEAAHNF